jgi:putative lipoprotein
VNLVLAFTLAFGAPPSRPKPLPDPWFGRDKAAHYTVSALIQGAAHAGLRWRGASYGSASLGAAAATAVAGIGKELWDKQRKRDFSLRDLTWDAAGGVTGAVIARQLDK